MLCSKPYRQNVTFWVFFWEISYRYTSRGEYGSQCVPEHLKTSTIALLSWAAWFSTKALYKATQLNSTPSGVELCRYVLDLRMHQNPFVGRATPGSVGKVHSAPDLIILTEVGRPWIQAGFRGLRSLVARLLLILTGPLRHSSTWRRLLKSTRVMI